MPSTASNLSAGPLLVVAGVAVTALSILVGGICGPMISGASLSVVTRAANCSFFYLLEKSSSKSLVVNEMKAVYGKLLPFILHYFHLTFFGVNLPQATGSSPYCNLGRCYYTCSHLQKKNLQL